MLCLVALPILATVNCAWNNVDSALTELRQYGSAEADHYLEAVASCAAALGALRSAHSAIVGPDTFDRLKPTPNYHIVGETPAGDSIQTNLGQRRQAACAALAERAVAQAAGSGVVGQDTERGRSLATLLRVTVGVVVPSHPYLQEVNVRIRTGLSASGRPVQRTLYADRAIGADLVMALVTCQAPILSTSELAGLGWTDIVDSEQLLGLCQSDGYKRGVWHGRHLEFRTLALNTCRKLIELQQECKQQQAPRRRWSLAELIRLIYVPQPSLSCRARSSQRLRPSAD